MPTLRIHHQINEIDSNQWDALCDNDYPFLRHAFLLALEESGCVCDDTGWHPLHLSLHQDDQLIAAMPLYLKTHSWGEYVFDWSWQEAWQQAGYEYFPKLVTAIPFTPSTGPRLIYARDKITFDEVLTLFVSTVRELCDEHKFSSWSGLFIPSDSLPTWQSAQLMTRQDCQFHWYNRGYQNFDDFLQTFTSRKRKNVRKERAKIASQNIQLRYYHGEDITPDLLDVFFDFYQLTYLKHGHYGHLNKDFFSRLITCMPEQIVLVMAYIDERPVAAAWSFKDTTTLYGRYWGCEQEFDSLHFETCYYQGIEYCIAHSLDHFDPGAQGEHKIQRGFEPIATWSVHWIATAPFRTAVERFLQQEQQYMQDKMVELASYLPFHQQ
ncbi:hypothetical protein SAMN04488136_13341 [Vibrio xiamenensis]|uniref:Uncharacterized protein n=1 Tax=Vibrio xiamenensis TaxID=861298 RepID=A0A1G8FZ53_9VIBR|nr:GNAT family N-acetyltransferase [Vibrio xiamenensis]SDH87401.1 hypothetical protein SAMN04488136_13341 [Vibrio xiamenensis]